MDNKYSPKSTQSESILEGLVKWQWMPYISSKLNGKGKVTRTNKVIIFWGSFTWEACVSTDSLGYKLRKIRSLEHSFSLLT